MCPIGSPLEQTESVGPHGDLIRAAEVRVARKSPRPSYNAEARARSLWGHPLDSGAKRWKEGCIGEASIR